MTSDPHAQRPDRTNESRYSDEVAERLLPFALKHLLDEERPSEELGDGPGVDETRLPVSWEDRLSYLRILQRFRELPLVMKRVVYRELSYLRGAPPSEQEGMLDLGRLKDMLTWKERYTDVWSAVHFVLTKNLGFSEEQVRGLFDRIGGWERGAEAVQGSRADEIMTCYEELSSSELRHAVLAEITEVYKRELVRLEALLDGRVVEIAPPDDAG